MRPPLRGHVLALIAIIALLPTACSPSRDTPPDRPEVTTPVGQGAEDQVAEQRSSGAAPTGPHGPTGTTPPVADADAVSSDQICDAAGLAGAIGGGAGEATLTALADEPAGAAIAEVPVLSTLTTAVGIADLTQTLDGAPALTILAPSDCAFAQLDPAALTTALADPQGRLTTLVGYHLIAGEQMAAADLSGQHRTFTGETITIDGTDVDGQATIVVPDVQTANATVHVIDAVLLPPSDGAVPTEG